APRIAVVPGELVLDRVSKSAKPGALRDPALDHETRDHAVEDGPVVESFLHELAEVSGRDRHRVVEELDLHVAHRRLKQDGRHASPIRTLYLKALRKATTGIGCGVSSTRKIMPRQMGSMYPLEQATVI